MKCHYMVQVFVIYSNSIKSYGRTYADVVLIVECWDEMKVCTCRYVYYFCVELKYVEVIWVEYVFVSKNNRLIINLEYFHVKIIYEEKCSKFTA